jgi:hypothetical protein
VTVDRGRRSAQVTLGFMIDLAGRVSRRPDNQVTPASAVTDLVALMFGIRTVGPEWAELYAAVQQATGDPFGYLPVRSVGRHANGRAPSPVEDVTVALLSGDFAG